MDMFALVEQENKELNVAPDDLIFSSRWPLSKQRLCTPAQLRRVSPTPIRWIA